LKEFDTGYLYRHNHSMKRRAAHRNTSVGCGGIWRTGATTNFTIMNLFNDAASSAKVLYDQMRRVDAHE